MANAAGFIQGTNKLNIQELFCKGEHVGIQDLKERDDIKSKQPKQPKEKDITDYIYKEIPDYPTPVEFHITNVSHVTIKSCVEGIWNSGGFKAGLNSLSWWSLYINESDKSEAEERYLSSKGLRAAQQPFLSKFTTSPAFDNDTSRYGNFRFTFPLAELMEAYKQQMCGGKEPVLKVYGTKLFKQKIEYIILVHSPQSGNDFPELPSQWVNYNENQIIWNAQAMSETHKCKLQRFENQVSIQDLQKRDQEFYVWDQVSFVFHISKVLTFPKRRLKEIYSYCALPAKSTLNLSNDINRSREEADNFIKSLPDK